MTTLSNLFNSVLSAISSFFIWIWDKIQAFGSWLFNDFWNAVTGYWWAFYARIVAWFANSISYLFPSDSLDFEDQTNLIIAQIGGWDQILPIHECFYLLNTLWVYFMSKMTVRYARAAFRAVRKLMPF